MRKHGLTLIDLIIVAAAIAILLTLTVFTAHLADETRNRIVCKSNLANIGQAIQLYANENRGMFPRASYVAANEAKAVWGTPYQGVDAPGAIATAEPFAPPNDPAVKTRPHANDVTAALYLLLRTQDINTSPFICPSTKQTKWDFGGGNATAAYWTNWQGDAGLRDHLSYSYQNQYSPHGSGGRYGQIPRELAIASDMNPGTNALLKLTPASAPEELHQGNSLNHAREGQNVLYADGRVQFELSPLVGVNQDNIFTYGPSGKDQPRGGDGIVGSPAGPNDSILLPTAKDIGLIDAAGNPLPATRPAGQ